MERRKAVANPSNKKNKEDEEMAETIVLLENQLRKLEKENENLQTEVKKNNSQTVGSKTNEQGQDFKIANEKLKQELQTLQKQNQKQKEEYTILESKQKIFERAVKEKDDRIAELAISTNQQLTQIATEKDKSNAYLQFIDQTKKEGTRSRN